MWRPSHGLELKTVFLITKIHLLSLRGSRTIKKVPYNIKNIDIDIDTQTIESAMSIEI